MLLDSAHYANAKSIPVLLEGQRIKGGRQGRLNPSIGSKAKPYRRIEVSQQIFYVIAVCVGYPDEVIHKKDTSVTTSQIFSLETNCTVPYK